jgi:MFS family permease
MALATTETGRHHRPGQPAAEEHSRTGAFWLVAGVLCLLFCAAGAPSPRYGIYRAQLRFSATTLLVFGSVSDYLGRRRVILAALVVTAGACAVFLAAHSTGLLFAARALQGVGVGTATGALGAAVAAGSLMLRRRALPRPLPWLRGGPHGARCWANQSRAGMLAASKPLTYASK